MRSKYHIFLFLFFLSGFAGLIYESVWTQYIRILLGHASFAQSYILNVFLAGLSAGAWLGGKLLNRRTNLFLLYGLAELGIGLLALGFHPMFLSIQSVIAENSGQEWAEPLGWVLIFLLTFPPTVMLGATFPLLAGAFQDRNSESRKKAVSQLYFINSAGAALGVLASGFILIPKFGLPETILTAGIFNLFIGLLAVCFSRINKELKWQANPKNNTGPPVGRFSLSAVLMVALITGASSMMYEVGWIRMLSMVLGSSAQAFELMVSSFIVGLALGAWWIYGRIAKLKSPKKYLIRVQLLMGMFALFSLLVYNQTFDLMAYLLELIPRDEGGYRLFNLGSNGIAFLVMLPAAICAGMTLPLMISILQQEGEHKQVIGNVYALNTFGGILGVLLAFGWFMPVFGLKYLMVIAAGLDMLAGIGLIIFYIKRKGLQSVSLATGSLMLLAISIVWFQPDTLKMASGVYRYGKIAVDKKILFHKDGKTASIAVAESDGGNLMLTTNGKPDASINISGRASGDEATQVLLAALPLSLVHQPDHVAVIGLGSGKTAHTVLMDSNILSVDVIEIEPAVAEAVQFFKPWAGNIFHDRRFHLYFDDARVYLSASRKKYDLIISEPSNPWISGMSGLFTGQFYKIAGSALTDGGVFVQWMHLYEMNMPLMVSVVKAFSPHFEDYEIYFLDDGDVVLIGRKSTNSGFPGNDIFTNAAMKSELGKLGILSEQDLNLRYIGNKKELNPFFFSYREPANTDFYPLLEYEATRARFLNEAVIAFDQLKTSIVPVLENLGGLKKQEALHPGPDYSFSISQNFRQAVIISDIFRDEVNGRVLALGTLDHHTALVIRNILSINRRGFDKASLAGWQSYFDVFAKKTLPYLDAGSLDFIFNFIESSSGYKILDDSQKFQIELYRALGKRDIEKLLHMTEVFRKNEPPKDVNMDAGVLKISVWALIRDKRYDEAKALLERYKNLQETDVVLRFLNSSI